MKKIKLITFHSADNQGAFLQAYALEKTIRELGFNTEIVDYRPPFIEKDYLKHKSPWRTFVKRVLQHFLFHFYVKKHLTLTKRTYHNHRDFIEHPLRTDHLVCGSDQIWNVKTTGGIDPVYFLDIPPANAARTAYAASMGETAIPEPSAGLFKEMTSRIAHLSVREEFARTQVSASGRPGAVPLVLDPTLLPEDFSAILSGKAAAGPFIALYFVAWDEALGKAALKLKKILGLPVVNISAHSFRRADKNELFLNPGQWLKRIKSAAVVCTNSFHGTALSVKFGRPFYAVRNGSEKDWAGNRISELLRSLGLEHRMADADGGIPDDREAVLNAADILKAVPLLKERQAASLDFIKQALSAPLLDLSLPGIAPI